MKLKKLLSFVAAAAMTITSLTSAMTFTASAGDFDYSTVFNFQHLSGTANYGYQAKAKDNYVDVLKAGGTTELVIPESYNDGTHGAAPVTMVDLFAIFEDAYITSLKFNSLTKEASDAVIADYQVLKKLEYPYEGENFTIKNDIAVSTWDTQCTSIEEIYFHASSVNCEANAFNTINDKVKIYVANEDVKNTIVEATASGSAPVSADQIQVMKDFDYSTVFNFQHLSGTANYGYQAKAKDNYVDVLKAGGTTELVIPESYDDGTHGTAPVTMVDLFAIFEDAYITSLKFNSLTKEASDAVIADYQVLKKLEYPYAGENFTIKNDIAVSTWDTQCTSIEEIYFHASSVNCEANAFNTINDKIKIYVVNEDVKNAIVEATASGSAPVTADQIFLFTPDTGVNKFEALDEALKNAKTYTVAGGYTITSINVLEDAVKAATSVRYTEASTEEEIANAITAINTAIEALVKRADFTALNEALENAKKYNNDECIYTDDSYKALTDAVAAANKLKDNWLDKSQPEADEATAAINNAINGLTLKPIDWSEFDTLLAQAEDIVNNHYDEYWELPMQSFARRVEEAKEFKTNNASATQAEINEQAKSLTTALNSIANSKIDKAALLEELNQVIAKAEKLDPADYTEESWNALASKIEAAKAITEESSPSVITEATTGVNTAIGKLALAKFDPIVKVEKGGKEVKIAELKADEKIAGASSIRFTFDCADDVSFNEYSTIDFKAVVAGKETFKQFKGDNYTTGGTNQVVLPLESAIKDGDSVVLNSSTWAWDNAKDYVYAITKVEFLNDEGNVMSKVTAKEIFTNDLAKAIADAEALDTAPYTEESVKVLTDAIAAAKALTDEATVDEINKAITAINDAVKGLVKKPAPTEPEPTNPEPSKPKPSVNPTTKPTTKATRSKDAVKKDKSAAKKAMKQAKISKLKVKSKAKKKINVSWKKVKKAKGYQVQVSTKKNFKKVIFKKDLKKTKLTIKNKKIKSKKTYYVRVRAYTTYKNANNKTVKVYSKWNKKLRKVKVR